MTSSALDLRYGACRRCCDIVVIVFAARLPQAPLIVVVVVGGVGGERQKQFPTAPSPGPLWSAGRVTPAWRDFAIKRKLSPTWAVSITA